MAIPPVSPVNIFFCHAPKDSALQAELEAHLSSLQQIKQITMWSDKNILAGADREQQIEAHLDAANIILILVSADFLASDYWYNIAMVRALKRHQVAKCYVIPIILRAVLWGDTPIGKLDVLPVGQKPVIEWSNRDKAWLDVARVIRETVRALLPTRLMSQEDIAILTPTQSSQSGQPPAPVVPPPLVLAPTQPDQPGQPPVPVVSPPLVPSPRETRILPPTQPGPWRQPLVITPPPVPSPRETRVLPPVRPDQPGQLPTPVVLQSPTPLRSRTGKRVKPPRFGVFQRLVLLGLTITMLTGGIFWLAIHQASLIGAAHISSTGTAHISPTSTSPTGTAHTSSTGIITQFPIPIPSGSDFQYGYEPQEITSGLDGNLWFTERAVSQIGRITPSGTITEFPLPDNSAPSAITAGPDGNLWFTAGSGKIGRITPSGKITDFSIPAFSSESELYDITKGPDGNLWFTESYGDTIGRITPSGTITEFLLPSTSNDNDPYGITSGPDGNLWFTETNANTIGRITPSGKITEFSLSALNSDSYANSYYGSPGGITAGPDGNLWFTENDQSLGEAKIGRITPSGKITDFSLPNFYCEAQEITAGPDGNLWFTEASATSGDNIERITPSGKITDFSLSGYDNDPDGITVGPDGNLWFTEFYGDTIGRITSGK